MATRPATATMTPIEYDAWKQQQDQLNAAQRQAALDEQARLDAKMALDAQFAANRTAMQGTISDVQLGKTDWMGNPLPRPEPTPAGTGLALLQPQGFKSPAVYNAPEGYRDPTTGLYWYNGGWHMDVFQPGGMNEDLRAPARTSGGITTLGASQQQGPWRAYDPSAPEYRPTPVSGLLNESGMPLDTSRETLNLRTGAYDIWDPRQMKYISKNDNPWIALGMSEDEYFGFDLPRARAGESMEDVARRAGAAAPGGVRTIEDVRRGGQGRIDPTTGSFVPPDVTGERQPDGTYYAGQAPDGGGRYFDPRTGQYWTQSGGWTTEAPQATGPAATTGAAAAGGEPTLVGKDASGANVYSDNIGHYWTEKTGWVNTNPAAGAATGATGGATPPVKAGPAPTSSAAPPAAKAAPRGPNGQPLASGTNTGVAGSTMRVADLPNGTRVYVYKPASVVAAPTKSNPGATKSVAAKWEEVPPGGTIPAGAQYRLSVPSSAIPKAEKTGSGFTSDFSALPRSLPDAADAEWQAGTSGQVFAAVASDAYHFDDLNLSVAAYGKDGKWHNLRVGDTIPAGTPFVAHRAKPKAGRSGGGGGGSSSVDFAALLNGGSASTAEEEAVQSDLGDTIMAKVKSLF